MIFQTPSKANEFEINFTFSVIVNRAPVRFELFSQIAGNLGGKYFSSVSFIFQFSSGSYLT